MDECKLSVEGLKDFDDGITEADTENRYKYIDNQMKPISITSY